MDIFLDRLDSTTQTKYREFEDQVKGLLEKYKQENPERFSYVEKKLEEAGDNWTKEIRLNSGDFYNGVNIAQLLAYEYGMASEKVTNGKVTFDQALDKLFNNLKRFKIGNPEKGKDDEYLYGKGMNDLTAIPVTSKKYRLVMNAGAQHLKFLQDDKYQEAVFIYKKQMINGFGKDEHGNNIDFPADGIDFDNLSSGQSLLTNLRQTTFHEWTHTLEKEQIDLDDPSIDYEYEGPDGKKYRNFEKVKDYVELDKTKPIKEPEYIKTDKLTEHGSPVVMAKGEDGVLYSLDSVEFPLVQKSLPREQVISTGLTTYELMPDGSTRINNMITEGFVEDIARKMVLAVDPDVKDIDEEKYVEYVKVADRVIALRDKAMGAEGQTVADMLMHSSTLKKDLESRTAILKDGKKQDGLHFIADLAEYLKHDKQINVDNMLSTDDEER